MQNRSISNLPILIVVVSLTTLISSFKADPPIYRKGWIDLNKNGKKDIYEDPLQPLNARIDNLLSQMTLEEKTCQMATLYGWKRVLKDSLPTKEWKTAIWKDGIANIDEHLNGFLTWGVTSTSELVTDIKKHVWAMNETQRFFIEQTRLGIPVDFTNEGIRGVEAYEATGFPTQLNMGMTWNRNLIRKMGRITGQEARALGYTNVYAPILDVARDQRWGRLEEVYGEDPYLVARLGVEMTLGMQENNQIASTAKHFAVYSANKGAREGLARTDPQVSPREVEDIMLYPFKKVIQEAGIMGVMSSYNDYNGIPITGSEYWLTQRLRKDFGFGGYVVSDSDALEYLYNKHHVAANLKEAVFQAFMAGLNVRTTFRPPDSIIIYARQLVNEGRIPIETINSRVKDVLRVKFKLGLFDQPYVKDAAASEKLVNSIAHQAVALQASKESIVLLKNNNQILPLSRSLKKIAVIGPNAADNDYAHTHYGPLQSKSTNILEGIRNKIGADKVWYAKGCELVDKNWPESEIFPEDPDATAIALIEDAVNTAMKADVAIVVLGGNTKTAGENKSRTTLELPGFQLNLIKAIQKTGKPVVAVMIGTQPMGINWIDKYIDGIVYAGYPGVKGGIAVADVLFGDYNPGGKLTLTFPKSVGQLPLNFPSKPNAQTDEGELAKIKGLLYPFGFGLSYTTFAYSNLKISPIEQEKDGNISISVDITNTAKLEGDEIVQLYIRDVLSTVTTYEKILRGFERISLKPNETKTLKFTLFPDDLKLWNREMQHVIEPGTFKVMIGASSEDIRLTGSFNIK
ncbi:glycoside hydrolase family 3 N-terminal domain-containing protein [Pedobacter heparinus]|uniref:Glycoside hydrolase family 3 domain protein n=1 Tax=Pedobacter heparinus (strain ATCC 13125 / DSM 2366 / CIP 104194 / JCM 7457 / NBRC 12017 / NCIMB 9290 / NRRL B-14731 / HIM 762-3) TaxID=485917 RepID=C6XYK2_PEDHD|nr:glycoside hydrolase family 3 N-terminal domain-containing protein [Pedobacter heparinus]ACU04484.1 glycoside hydrolase family 3 domain protein [Pedobacter heparinus DSM 2366]